VICAADVVSHNSGDNTCTTAPIATACMACHCLAVAHCRPDIVSASYLFQTEAGAYLGQVCARHLNQPCQLLDLLAIVVGHCLLVTLAHGLECLQSVPQASDSGVFELPGSFTSYMHHPQCGEHDMI
jgi:hypothetical protein